MATASVTLPSGASFEKKVLTIDSDYAGSAVDLKSGSDFKDLGATTVNTSKVTKNLTITTGDKATTVITSANTSANTTIVSGKGADKISLGGGKDVVSFTPGSSGNDVISNYSTNDTIAVSGKTAAQSTFVDKAGTVTVTFNGAKDKLTINKATANDHINFTFNGTTYKYGELPTGASYGDNNKTTLNISGNVGNGTPTINASQIASTIKNINASGVTDSKKALYLVGNGQANSITIGAGGGTIDGGWAADGAKGTNKATSDKLYGGAGSDTFVINSSLGGSDMIYNYDSGDKIYVSDMKRDDLVKVVADSKLFKDSGKNITITLNKSKLTIDGTPKQVSLVGSDSNTPVVYGPSLPNGTYVDQKKTTLYITSDTATVSSVYEYALGDTLFSANNYAPKLKTIDASTYKGRVKLGSADSSIAGEFKGSAGASTLIGGKQADTFVGNANGSDTIVYTLNGTVGGGKDKVSSIGGVADGDIIKLEGYQDSLHAVSMTAKGSKVTVAITAKSNNKAIGQLELNVNPNDKTLVVVDGNNKIISSLRDGNPVTPIGLNYNEKSGISTTDKYDGAYESGSYLVGDTLNTTTYAATPHTSTPAVATINAADYSTKLTAINASTVSSDIEEILIIGNESVKNVLTAPNATSLLDDESTTSISTTLKGGLTQADVLNGSSLAGSTDYFWITPSSTSAKKDTIVNYGEGDVLLITRTTNVNENSIKNLQSSDNKSTQIKLDDKGSDAILTLDKSTVTIKDGAGQAINIQIVDADGNPVSGGTVENIGHLLPNGLKYDAKKVTISVKPTATVQAAQIGGNTTIPGIAQNYGNNDSDNPDNLGYVKIDLNNSNYFTTVKTINLKNVNAKVPGDDDPTIVEDNSVHVTLLGNSLANDFYAGGNASSTTIFYGGKGDLNKPEADKFYGGVGMDVFVYELGDGKDQISDSKSNADTKYNANDYIVLGSNDSSKILSSSDLFITDNGSVVNVQIGTDTKKGALSIYKADSNTPINFILTKDSNTALAVASSITAGKFVDSDDNSLLKNGYSTNDFVVYKYGMGEDTLTTEISGKKLTIGDYKNITVTSDEETLAPDEDASIFAAPAIANVNLKDISSAITNVDVSSKKTDMLVNIVGNNNANAITLGAGGSTVDGGYSVDSKGKIKATADKYYGGAGSDVFVYKTLVDNGNDVGGKDIIYNYEQGADAIRINSISDIKSVAYNEKTIAFTFNGAKSTSKNNVLTLQGTNASSSSVPSDTQISFIVGEDGNTSVRTFTYFDKKSSTVMGALTEVINPWSAYQTYTEGSDNNRLWTTASEKSDLNFWHYTNNDWTHNGLNFTIQNVANRYGYADSYTITSGKALDVQSNITGIRPLGVSIEEPYGNVIEVDQITVSRGKDVATMSVVNLEDFIFNANTAVGKNGVHIKGIEMSFSDSLNTVYDEEAVAQVGTGENSRGTYRLANLDGDTTNGYELLKTNELWDLTKNNRWLYHGDEVQFTVTPGVDNILDVRNWGDAATNEAYDAETYNDLYAGSPVNFYVDGSHITVTGDDVAASMISFANDTAKAGFDSSEIIKPGDEQVNGGTDNDHIHIRGFNTDTTFVISDVQPAANAKAKDTVTPYTYTLAELDGNTINGYELLKKNDRWKLTEEGWDYSSGSTKFTVKLVSPVLLATEDGAADGISVQTHASMTANGTLSASLTNSALGTVIDFSGVDLNVGSEGGAASLENSVVAFDGGVTTGRNGLHIKGLDYNETVAVGDEAYRLVNLDIDRMAASDYRQYKDSDGKSYSNGLELVKVNENWTPVYKEDGADQDWAYAGDNVRFTITSGSSAYSIDSSSKETVAVEDGAIFRTFGVDSTGAVQNISVGDDGVINFGSALTSIATITVGKDKATINPLLSFGDIVFESDTKVGADGIHIKGFAADSTVVINHVTGEDGESTVATIYQLVDLDNNTSNGYELMAVDSTGAWSLDKGKWTYDNGAEDAEAHLKFTFESTSGLVATDNGTIAGVSVETAESGAATISFGLGSSSLTKALNGLKFYNIPESDDVYNLKFVGVPEDTKLSFVAKESLNASGVVVKETLESYQVVNITDDATEDNPTEPFELMKVDSNWSLSGGKWSFSNASTTNPIAFSISANASLRADYDGTPALAWYYVEEDEGDNGRNIYRSSVSLAEATNFIATDLTITALGKSGSSVVGANGLHFVLPYTEEVGEDENASIPAGVMQQDTRMTIGGVTYQLVNLDDDEEDYELMKTDNFWTLSSDDEQGRMWTYSSGTTLAFTIGSDAELAPKDSGIPDGVTLIGGASGAATLRLSNDFENLKNISIGKATYGTVANALRIVGASLTAGEEITLGSDSVSSYRIIDLDNKAGYELMKVNPNWNYHISEDSTTSTYKPNNSWTYSYTYTVGGGGEDAEPTLTTIGFEIGSTTSTNPTSDGIPTGTSFDTSTKVLTIPAAVVTVTGGKITLNADNLVVGTDTSANSAAKAFHVKATNLAEGTTIQAYDSTESTTTYYHLYNADGNANNGLELTYNGWLPSTIKGRSNSDVTADAALKFKSDKAAFTLSGGAFGTTSLVSSDDDGNDRVYGYTNADAAQNITVTSANVLTLKSQKSDNSYINWDTASDQFHVAGTGLSANSTLKVNDVTFKLVQFDGNANNGFELSNGGWVKTGDTSFVYQGSDNKSLFTVTGGADVSINGGVSTADSVKRGDNIPDGFTFINSTTGKPQVTLKFDSEEYATTEGLTFIGPKAWSSTAVVSVTGATADDTYSVVTETIEGNTSLREYTIKYEGKADGDQLPANSYDALTTTGYDIDDILNYESEAATSDELSSITEVKSLAYGSDEVFDLINSLDAKAKQSVATFVNVARHKAQK